MNVASRLAQLFTRRHPPPGAHGEPDRHRLAEAVERIIELSPHLRMARRHEARLEPAVAVALRYVAGLVAAIPQAREASAAAWAADPYIRSFFPGADSVATLMSRSHDLRAFFEQNPWLQEAWAVLGMAMSEKRVLGATLEGDTMRRDEVRQTISFSDHQVRICGRSEAELREEIVRRLVAQLGLQGIARYSAQQAQRGLLENERALLRTRLALLERKGVGVGALVGGRAEGAGSDELARLQEAFAENEAAMQRLGLRSEALDRELGEVCAVLADPAAHLFVSTRRCVLDRMNVVQPPDSGAGDEVVFEVAQLPTVPPEARAFTLVRFARADLRAPGGLLDDAARSLG